MRDPIVPDPAPPDAPRLFYKRSLKWPRAVAWFGFSAFWGHLWHLVASVLATEDIDSRDWMVADEPEDLTRRVARRLGAPNPEASSLTEALDRDLWIDFVADTGDDFAVSRVVARMLVAEYDVEDPSTPGARLHLPRGDVLVFGGDTAYPVATDVEIHNRLIVPWNQALRSADDGRPRALLGVPGNHDWYAGLDGFGRMFRRRRAKLDRAETKDKVGTDDEVDRLGQIGHFIEWVEAFRVGEFVEKRAALALVGYEPEQSASYFALELAPSLSMWGPDRQLRRIDFGQRGYFAEQRAKGRGVVLVTADPVWSFLEPNPPGVGMLEALHVDVKKDALLVLTGDTHQYCRQRVGDGVHVTAGGGGAFLHPARVARRGLAAPEAEFPGPKATLPLLLQVPWQIVHGRSGFLVHAAVALAYAPTFWVQWRTGSAATLTCALTGLVASAICVGLGGFRRNFLRVAALSVVTGAAVGFFPLEVHAIVAALGRLFGGDLSALSAAVASYGLSVYVGTLAIGAFLMLLTLFGLEQHQALSALGHPGYKHFVRLRVRRDGSGVDGWVLGRVDPLAKGDRIVLVDRFSWANPRAGLPGH